MTLDEMRQQLQMSKPSMSAGVKKLQEYDIVKQQFTRGSRKQHFIAEKDFFTFFRNFSQKMGTKSIQTWKQLKMLKLFQTSLKQQ